MRVSHSEPAAPTQVDVSESSSQEVENGTPIGSPVWTFDCGPTFSNSLPFGSSSSYIEEQTFPSLNTAMINHDKERIMRQRDVKKNPPPSQKTSIEGRHHSSDTEEVVQESNLHPNSENPSIPTFSQLQKLLSIRRDPSAAPAKQTASGFVTPRMPSPSLGALESFDMSSPASYSTHRDSPQLQIRPTKKRRMQSEVDSIEQGSSRVKSGQNTPLDDVQTLIEEDRPSRKASLSKVPRGRMEQDALTTIIASEDDEGTDISSEEHEAAQIVESSQPSLDVTMLSLMPSSRPFNRKPQRTQRSRKSTNPTTIPPRESTVNNTPSPPDQVSSVNGRDIDSQQMITCIFTGLNKEQRESFDQNITHVIEAGLLMEHIQDQPFSKSTTHIITNADTNALKNEGVALCPRVLKYLHGMLSKPWIVRHDWFVDSIKAGAWLPLPQPKYLIQGDTQYGPAPGTQLRREIRLRRSMKLFNSCRMFFYGNFGGPGQKSITKDELLRLVRDGGAETWQRRPASKPLLTLNPGGATTAGEAHGQSFFGASRFFLYVTEDVKPWEVPLDRTAPIVVCDPASIPSGYPKGGHAGATNQLTQSDLKKHGWLRDYQAVSLMWLLNCISCSIMGTQDIELLYGPKSDKDSIGEEEILKLSQAWTQWRNRNRQQVHSDE
ncbi:BRCA1-associated RING domain protein 1 [Mortierella sp. AM989]|nr:BRCA1-associated RING domain protein 1 [Mortierella sp. AM989]